jgi:hypothetical protein
MVVGSRDDVGAYARRRARRSDPDERAWLQNVVGALAIDVFDPAPSSRSGAPYAAPDRSPPPPSGAAVSSDSS